MSNMDWNDFAIGGELNRTPDTGEIYARLSILDRRTGKGRNAPVSPSELEQLIGSLTLLKDALAAASASSAGL